MNWSELLASGHGHERRAETHLQLLARRDDRAQEVVIVDADEAERALHLAVRLDVPDLLPA